MAAITSSLCGNPRRVIHMLWISAAIMFLFAVFHSTSLGSQSKEWMTTKVSTITGGAGGGRSSMKDFMARAEASWAKTVKQRHDLIRKDWGTSAKLPLYAAVDSTSYYKTPYTVWDFTPASYGCPHEIERIGRMGDGGKWVCGMSRIEAAANVKPCVIYSFGVRDESSFENEMLSRTKCEVWAYDFSVVDFGEQLEESNRARAKFSQVGISGTTDTTKTPPFYSIADLMKQNGHDYIDLLKMDIEFAEFEAMDGISRDFPAEDGKEVPIGQFLVEIHLFGDRMPASGYLAWWERLEARGFRPAWTEPNLLAVTLNNNGDHNPNMAEYTLLNVKDRRSIFLN